MLTYDMSCLYVIGRERQRKVKAIPNVQESFLLRSNFGNLTDITRLDQTIYGVVGGRALLDLYYLIEHFEDFLKTDFWVSWVIYTKQLLKMLMEAPKIVHDFQVRDDLQYVYNEQFTRLTRRIGIKEFVEIIGWSQRKLTAFRSNGNPMPEPVDILAATPVWTLGQDARV